MSPVALDQLSLASVAGTRRAGLKLLLLRSRAPRSPRSSSRSRIISWHGRVPTPPAHALEPGPVATGESHHRKPARCTSRIVGFTHRLICLRFAEPGNHFRNGRTERGICEAQHALRGRSVRKDIQRTMPEDRPSLLPGFGPCGEVERPCSRNSSRSVGRAGGSDLFRAALERRVVVIDECHLLLHDSSRSTNIPS